MADLFWVLKDFGGILGPLGEGFADLFAGFAEMEKGVALGGIAGATGVIGGLLAGVQGLQALGLEFSFKEDSNIGKMMAANKAFGDIMSTASAEGFKWTLEFAKQVEALKSTMSGDKANILQNLLDKIALQTIEMGFGSLIAKAKEFGLDGGRIVIETLQEIEANGLRIAEVERYKNEQLDAGLVAYKQMREAVGQN